MNVKAGTRHIHVYEAADWHVPRPGGDTSEVAGPDEVGRRLLVQGDNDFFTQVVRLPPGFTAPSHSHDHAEVFMVLEGSCSFDGVAMSRFDSTVVDANESYGFTAGPEGLVFLVVRQGRAEFRAEPS